MRVFILSSFFLLMAATVYGQDPSCYPCDPTWPRAIYYPNYNDCSTVWKCEKGNITSLAECTDPEVMDFLAQRCSTEEDAFLSCKSLVTKAC